MDLLPDESHLVRNVPLLGLIEIHLTVLVLFVNSEDLTLNPSSRVQVVKLVVVLGCLCPPPPKVHATQLLTGCFCFRHNSYFYSCFKIGFPTLRADCASCCLRSLLVLMVSSGFIHLCRLTCLKFKCNIMANHTLENALCACVRVSLECSIDGLMILHWWEISLEPHFICDIFLDHLCRTELSSSQKNLLKNPPFYPLHHREAGLTPATNMIKFSLIHQSWSCD